MFRLSPHVMNHCREAGAEFVQAFRHLGEGGHEGKRTWCSRAVSSERCFAPFQEFWLFVISIIVSVGMWLERFVIIVTSLHRDFLPSSWAMYSPTMFDISMFTGTIGFFFTLIYLFVRFVPIISIWEMKAGLPSRMDSAVLAEARLQSNRLDTEVPRAIGSEGAPR